MAHALSEDLLYLIFLHALPFRVTVTATPIDPRITPPFNFSTVCRAWRSVVASRPSLWGSICIEAGPAHSGTYDVHPSMLQFVAKCIENSVDAPLDVKLKLFKTADNLAYELLVLILAHSQRFREIDIDFISVGARRVARESSVSKSITVQCPPSVISIKLGFEDTTVTRPSTTSVYLDLSSWTTVNAGARLRVLRLFSNAHYNLNWRLPEHREALYLPNLRVLEFNINLVTDLDDSFALLTACPNISTLKIAVTYGDTSALPLAYNGGKARIIILHHLAHLAFYSDNHSITQCLLNHLSCPFLRNFEFSVSKISTFINIPQYLRDIAAFLLCSGSGGVCPPLAELKLRYLMVVREISPESHREHKVALKELLSILYALDRLDISAPILDDDLIKPLTFGVDEVQGGTRLALCPSLSRICLASLANHRLQKETLEDMIISRWRAGRRFRSVKLRMSGFEKFGDESERLRECLEEGFELDCRERNSAGNPWAFVEI